MHSVDNSAMSRKLALLARQQGVPINLGALGDYPADLPNRILSTKGGAGQQGGAVGGQWGPVTAPTVQGEMPETTLSLLHDIKELLRRLPQEMLLEMRTQLVLTPREAVSFVAMSGTVVVPAGSIPTIVASQTIPPRFCGFVTKVGINVLPPGSLPDITWQIRIGGTGAAGTTAANSTIHPEFANRIYSSNNFSSPDDFTLEVVQGRTVQLVAINTTALAIDVQGKLVGWMEFLTDNKSYGGSPMTGIA